MSETIRGRISVLPDNILEKSDSIVKLYYDEHLRQTQIKEVLGLGSTSQVAEVLRRDMTERVKAFKKLKKESPDYSTQLQNIVCFLKFDRKLGYTSISTMLEIPKEDLISLINHLPQKTARRVLSMEERRERDNLMKKMALEGYTLQEIGIKVGVSKQRVSRIFTEMGFKPIKGTRQTKMKSTLSTSDINQLMMADFNAKLTEQSTKYRRLKMQYATLKAYHAEKMAELRCMLLEEIMANISVANFENYKLQRRLIKAIYNKYKETNKTGDVVRKVNDIVQKINNFEGTVAYQRLLKCVSK